MNLYIDMGGTNFRYRFNKNKLVSIKTKDVNLLAFLDKTLRSKKIEKIGISFAGQVKDGAILDSPNIDTGKLDIKKIIEEKYPVRLEIENDLNCAALYESSLYKKYKTIVVLYIGTGFGGAIVNNGSLILGANNLAAEVGHIPFMKTPFRCGCQRDDCVELVSSGNALKLWCNHLKLDSNDITLDSLKSTQIYDNFVNGLKHTFLTLTSVLDPDLFIFGGSVVKNNPYLIELLKESSEQAPFASIRKAPKIVLSKNENGALMGTELLFD